MPSHRTPSGSKIGNSRGFHSAGHVGKAASSTMSLSRRSDAQLDNPQPPSDAPRPAQNTPVVGVNRNVIDSR